MHARWFLPGLALAVCAACEGKVRERDAGSDPGAAAAFTAPAVAINPVECQQGDQIDPRERAEVEGHAKRVVTGLRGGAAHPLWNDLHPDLRQPEDREAFLGALGGLQERLRVAQADAVLTETVLITVAPGVKEDLRIRCGGQTPDAADDLTVTTRVEGESLALVNLEVQGPVVAEGLVVRLRKRGTQWFLVAVEGNPVRLGPGGSTVFEGRGDELARNNEAVGAYLQYGLAQTLTGRGSGVVTAGGQRINDKLQGLVNSPAYKAASTSIKVGGKNLELLRLGLSASPAGVAPNIKYLTAHDLGDTEAVAAEASALVVAFQEQHPSVAEVFDTALVEAYRERPTDGARALDAFQTVVTLQKPPANAGPGAVPSLHP